MHLSELRNMEKLISRGNDDKSEKGIKKCYKELCTASMILLGRGGRGRGKQIFLGPFVLHNDGLLVPAYVILLGMAKRGFQSECFYLER